MSKSVIYLVLSLFNFNVNVLTGSSDLPTQQGMTRQGSEMSKVSVSASFSMNGAENGDWQS